MHAPNQSPTFTFTAEVTSLLRQVAHANQGRRVTIDDLRDALDRMVEDEPPPTTLRMTPPLNALLARAWVLATERRSPNVARQDVCQALAEAAAIEAGVNVARLSFARWRLHRQYTMDPRKRVHTDPQNSMATTREERNV
jgi:hypothetical protein